MEEITLSYLLSNPFHAGIGVSRPLILLLLSALPLLQRQPLPGGKHATTLRSTAFAALVLAMAGLHLTSSLPANEVTVVAAVDLSGSISDHSLDWARQSVRNLSTRLAPGDEIAVLGFAASADLISPTTSTVAPDTIERPEDIAATNISAALDQALALFPMNRQKAIVLLSDGNETTGHARDRIASLRAMGVRVHTASPPRDDGLDVRITKVTVPRLTAAERPLPLRVVVHNPRSARPAVLNLQLDGLLSDSRAITLDSGLNTFDLTLRAPDIGGHVLRAQVAVDGDRAIENNSREASINVRDKTHVVLATKRRYSALYNTLLERGFSVSRITPGKLPTSASDLATAHLVVLEDVRGGLVTKDSIAALEEFVSRRGGGLIFAGGGGSYGDRDWQKTDLVDLLPVTLEPRRPKPGKREPLALFLLVDRSSSMSFNSRISTIRDHEKLRYAIKASIAVIKQLKSHDQVGVIVFDSQPHEIAPLRPLKENRRKLLEALPRIVENGGTDFFDAMRIAERQLQHSRVGRKHIVLLTDGDTNRSDASEYNGIIEQLAASDISVTTIRIGDNTVNLQLLQDISNATGGSFHHIANAKRLPDLMLRDTSRALKPLTPDDQRYLPAFATKHRLLSEVREEEVPHLVDYAFSKPKAGSETLLHVARAERRDPILSVWRYGLGRVAAFTASPADDAETWRSWKGYSRFWSQLAFWASRLANEHDITAHVVRHGDSVEVVARGFSEFRPVTGNLWVDDVALPLNFSVDKGGSYRATAPSISPGRYRLSIIERDRNGSVRETSMYTAVPSRNEREIEEFASSGNNDELLRKLAQRTGGTHNAAAAEILDRPAGTRKVSYPLVGLLVPLAMLAFFCDIALRRTRVKRES